MESCYAPDTLTETPPGAALVLEDNALGDMIKDLDYVLAGAAASLAEALSFVAAGNFDVALIDLHPRKLALPVADAARPLKQAAPLREWHR